MRKKRTTLELPADLVDLLESAGEDLSRGVEEALVVELIKRDLLSSRKAADILGVTHDAMRELMWERGVPYFRQSAEEVLHEADVVQSLYRTRRE